jgi:hypothetical protein
MTLLDDAICDQLSHAAGSQADPLTESLCSQTSGFAPLTPEKVDAALAEAEYAVSLPLWAVGACALMGVLAAFMAPATPEEYAAYRQAKQQAASAASGVRP